MSLLAHDRQLREIAQERASGRRPVACLTGRLRRLKLARDQYGAAAGGEVVAVAAAPPIRLGACPAPGCAGRVVALRRRCTTCRVQCLVLTLADGAVSLRPGPVSFRRLVAGSVCSGEEWSPAAQLLAAQFARDAGYSDGIPISISRALHYLAAVLIAFGLFPEDEQAAVAALADAVVVDRAAALGGRELAEREIVYKALAAAERRLRAPALCGAGAVVGLARALMGLAFRAMPGFDDVEGGGVLRR